MIRLSIFWTIQNRYELAVVFSDKLSEIKEQINVDLDIEWLGVDIDYSGYGSLLREGIFRKTTLFADFINHLNSNGLFNDDKNMMEKYITSYSEIALHNNIESINDLTTDLKDFIKIGKVNG